MDLLGKDGEKAVDAVHNLSDRVEDLESHLNAVDSAVQDTRRESRETDFEVARENRERLVQLEDMMRQLTDIQKRSLKDIDSERSRENRLKAMIESVQTSLKTVQKEQSRLESRIDGVEDKLFELEDELTNEIGLNQGRIESKVSESSFEDENKQLKREISRLKTSINALADDLDDDKVRVE